MQLTITQTGLDQTAADLLVVSLFEAQSPADAGLAALDRALGGALGQVIELGDFKGEALSTRLLYTAGKDVNAGRVLLVGLGKVDEFSVAVARRAAGVAARSLVELKLRRLATVVHGLDRLPQAAAELAQAVVEGTWQGAYRFVSHRHDEDRSRAAVDVDELRLAVPEGRASADLEAGARAGQIIGETASLVCDLVNEPGNLITPSVLAGRAQDMVAGTGINCKVYGEAAMAELGMASFLSVGQGSAQESQFVVLEYFPERAAGDDTIVLVGKAITFDTGGISIKPNQNMWKMKNDMGGGAAVLGTLRAAALLKLPVRVVGLICAAENMPGPTAVKPGDVVTASNGKTIEYISTDAEGRMVLADGLSYAARYEPAAIVDCATLTGSIGRALGLQVSGVFCTDDGLYGRLAAAADAVDEPSWRMPLYRPYRELINSDVADMKNSGGAWGGAIIAALFLQEFVPEQTPWAHMDVAGTAFTDEHRPYALRGATANPMRTLLHLVRTWYDA